ncbi:hypothetical protein P3T76_015297 [Phytophthora citrophthora]|uniref:Uncharacterized protein n=1 Tax=Phytophthora citrophthora TaxID=4793 RepID=A0AAD9LBH8_9STRA|nr:hypothetical protein P3T76_015297 [Phytophthora citrophthora]
MMNVIKELEHFRRRLQQGDDNCCVEIPCGALHGLADVVCGGTVETRTDLIKQLKTLHTEHHFTRRDTLPFTSRHTTKHGVTHDRVLTVVKSKFLHCNIGSELVVCVEDLHGVIVVLGRAVLERLHCPRLHTRSSAALVSELEGLLDRQTRVVVVDLVGVGDVTRKHLQKTVAVLAIVVNVAIQRNVGVHVEPVAQYFHERRLTRSGLA